MQLLASGEILNWLSKHWLEAFGMITGLWYIYLEIKEKILLWPVGLISSLVYIIVFYSSGFYADMSMQFYYVVVSVYGWILWYKKGNDEQSDFKISRLPVKLYFLLFGISVILWGGIDFILRILPGAAMPFWDSFTTAFSITATWMLARKYIEQWIVWIVVDFVSACLYVYKHLYFTAFLFVVFTIFAVIGYLEWKKIMKKDNAQVVGK